MRKNNIWSLFILLLVVVIMLAACSAPDEEPTAAPVVEEPTKEPVAEEPTEEPAEEEVAEVPSDLNIAIVTFSLDTMWDASFFESMDRVIAEKPHDLEITYDYTEGVWGDDAAVVIREYAESGEYDIIWTTSSYSDQVKPLKDEYPETMFIYQGSGNEGLGGNAFWLYMRVHEASYLLGQLAGKLGENNTVGVAGTFAFDDVNDEINSFIQGAKDANPETQAKVSFIESWYDPVAGNEATNAQAAAGADWVLQLADGWEACVSSDIMCFGNFGDQNYLAPDNVPSSTVAMWDPGIKWLIDEWWGHAAEGQPWNGNTEKRWFTMAEGGADIAPINDLGGRIPQDVIDEIMQLRQDILDGNLEIPLDIEVPKSD